MGKEVMAEIIEASAIGKQLVEKYRREFAETLLLAGLTLIPSDDLKDHQIVVSRGIYDAAIRKREELRKPV